MDNITVNIIETIEAVSVAVIEALDEINVNIADGSQGVIITVGTVAPPAPSINDLWLDTN